jgi:hypothetical protein
MTTAIAHSGLSNHKCGEFTAEFEDKAIGWCESVPPAVLVPAFAS